MVVANDQILELKADFKPAAYFTISTPPSGDFAASGVLPYAPRLTRRTFGFGSFA